MIGDRTAITTSPGEHACPFCGSNMVIPIHFGFPVPGMEEREKKDEILLGGCVMSGYDQNWYCKDCDSKWMGDYGPMPMITGHGVVVTGPPSFQHPAIPVIEQRILEVAWNVCGRSHVKPPRRVEWKKTTGLRSDYCAVRGDALVLPASLRGKLDPEEWRPLIYASLMLRERFGRATPASIAHDFLFVLALLSIIVGAVLVFGSSGPALVGIVLLIAGIEVLRRFLRRGQEDKRRWLITDEIAASEDKRRWLIMDEIAALEMGRGNMLRALRKIDSLRLPDVELSKSGRLTRPGWVKEPGITERIVNLETSR